MASKFFGLTDTGRIRDNNEDTFIAEEVLGGRCVMACVVDGVGGYEGGEVAAQIAKESILHYFSIPSGDIMTMMKEALTLANEKIQTQKQQANANKSMACVVTLAVVDTKEKKFYYAHVGDTRLYLFRDQSLIKITKDHSFVGYLEDSGRISEQEAMTHPKRNEINKALGFDGQLKLADDYIETGESPFLPGDTLLLCSDGLSDLVNKNDITTVLLAATSLEEKADQLIHLANEAGGKDNITVVLVKNEARQVKYRATKPSASAQKVVEEPGEEIEESYVPVKRAPLKRKTSSDTDKILIVVLIIVCLVLLGALLWQIFYNKPATPSVPMTSEAIKNAQELKIYDSLQSFSSTLLLDDRFFTQSIVLTDTIFIDKDSLHIIGKGNVRLVADSTFKGPALFIASTAKYVLLENIKLEGFDQGIISQSKGLRLKGVQFKNCRTPLQYQYQFPDNGFVNGAVDSFKVTTDSLVLKTATK
jgi:serine/threonine protein phosphatase PrpC